MTELLIDPGVIIGAGGAVVAAIGLLITARSYRQEARSRYFQTLSDFYHELGNLESSQIRNEDYKLFGAKYLAVTNRVAYLACNNIIPQNIARYFDDNLSAAYAMLQDGSEFKSRVTQNEFNEYYNGANDLRTWCQKIGIQAKNEPKPHPEASEDNEQSTTNEIRTNQNGKKVGSGSKTNMNSN